MGNNDMFNICEEILTEDWYGATMRRPKMKGGAETPTETQQSLQYKGTKIGTPEVNLYQQAQDNGQYPYEQEEAADFLIDDFEQWWDNHSQNYNFESSTSAGEAKHCAFEAWKKSYETYV